MKQALVVVAPQFQAPGLVAAAGPQAELHFVEFFAGTIRNANTRRGYMRAVGEFLDSCAAMDAPSIVAIEPLHVAAYIEWLTQQKSAPTAKARLAAVRSLFDWLVVKQVVPANPASSVRDPQHSVKRSKTPLLATDEAPQFLDAIDVSTPVGLRHPALIGLMVYSFARIGAVLGLKVEDVFMQNRRLWVRLHEMGGKQHEMSCHHNLEAYLQACIESCGLAGDPKGPVFRTIGRGTHQLTAAPLTQPNAYAIVRRRAAAAGIEIKIGNHTFRATGITAYLKNGGVLEKAAAMASHSSTRTTQLYDRRWDEMTLDEIERVLI